MTKAHLAAASDLTPSTPGSNKNDFIRYRLSPITDTAAIKLIML